MKQLSTKERIRTEALHLFAQYGYDAISVAQIAKAVAYRHRPYTSIMQARRTFSLPL